jgi:hypothetical protein
MAGLWSDPPVRRKHLLGIKVLKAVVPGLSIDRRQLTHSRLPQVALFKKYTFGFCLDRLPRSKYNGMSKNKSF